MTRLNRSGVEMVAREPLRANRVFVINTPPPVGDDRGIDGGHHPTPGPRTYPQLPLRIPAVLP